MEHVLRHLAVSGLMLVIFLSVVWRLGNTRRWELRVEEDLAAALQRFNIMQHDLLMDQVVRPGPSRMGQVYRILHDRQGHYFLYLHMQGHKGMLKPLTPEQALLAVKMNA
ncbi:hypothetical protein [Pseudomonas aegrilactucae]|uniref:Uncharacterized protein n=1 Tax=Pseudomonas aegrilactucae TaxID=2854028 RepID=A0A9Q2XFQ0_9PSED|nr:hypothetical protein [Pseudomonas aegrilactucae]MBV6286163.1 hypothetical protein [Pseudomonas aegrilactucae]